MLDTSETRRLHKTDPLCVPSVRGVCVCAQQKRLSRGPEALSSMPVGTGNKWDIGETRIFRALRLSDRKETPRIDRFSLVIPKPPLHLV